MKTKLVILASVIFIAFHAYSQNPSTPQMLSSGTNMMQNMNGIGSVLTTLGKGIDPSALTSEFAGEMSSWTSKASALKPDDVKGASGLVSQLIGGIKPALFNSKVKPDDLMSKTEKATSMSDLGNSISTLVHGLNPSAFTKDFALNKNSFLKSLSAMSSMK